MWCNCINPISTTARHQTKFSMWYRRCASLPDIMVIFHEGSCLSHNWVAVHRIRKSGNTADWRVKSNFVRFMWRLYMIFLFITRFVTPRWYSASALTNMVDLITIFHHSIICLRQHSLHCTTFLLPYVINMQCKICIHLPSPELYVHTSNVCMLQMLFFSLKCFLLSLISFKTR